MPLPHAPTARDTRPDHPSRARRGRRRARWALALGAAVLGITGCAAPDPVAPRSEDRPWTEVLQEAQGQTVDLWMFGGDERGNAYVDDVLAPAAADLGVTLRRVPVADTSEALQRMLAERAAGSTDGAVDLVWVNGDNFATGKQAGAWLCGWADDLPNARFLDPQDPLLTADFGEPVDGCESPWHKAQFTFAYDSAAIPEPPRTLEGLLDWAQDHPGRFTYPAPPDFTGSVFVRQALYAVAGGATRVPPRFEQAAADRLTPALWERLRSLAPSLWREGRTYPRDVAALERLYARGEVDVTMTYGPATLTALVADGTFPATTRVLTLEDGTVGNASFLGIPATSPDQAGAMVVADLALSPAQQAAKADPAVWGQFTVLDAGRLDAADAALFAALPRSPVVPPYEVLSKGAVPELASDWVGPLDDGWRREVLGRR
ncbi:ABC transporter substrate-binding protein [Nocardioides sp.]|uniref:ABC transporter substrate-binding protein n=1 Tax=Nocardioides sp. TaxID=35761 RepID=UPI003517B157